MRKKLLMVEKTWLALPRRHHRRPDLAPENVAVGLGHHSGPIDEGFHFRRHVGEKRDGPEKNAVRRIFSMQSLTMSVLTAQRRSLSSQQR